MADKAMVFLCKYLECVADNNGIIFNLWDFLLGVGPLRFSISCFAYNSNDFFPLVVHARR
jgi:hypothetical protein